MEQKNDIIEIARQIWEKEFKWQSVVSKATNDSETKSMDAHKISGGRRVQRDH